jgi:hypothetical protein
VSSSDEVSAAAVPAAAPPAAAEVVDAVEAAMPARPVVQRAPACQNFWKVIGLVTLLYEGNIEK